jgi:hypothetical protein
MIGGVTLRSAGSGVTNVRLAPRRKQPVWLAPGHAKQHAEREQKIAIGM